MFSKIDKRKQPELKHFYLSSISGEYLFDLNENIGWPMLESLKLSGSNKNNLSKNIGFRNICQYNFANFKILTISKTNKYLENFKLSKNSFKFILKAQWNTL